MCRKTSRLSEVRSSASPVNLFAEPARQRADGCRDAGPARSRAGLGEAFVAQKYFGSVLINCTSTLRRWENSPFRDRLDFHRKESVVVVQDLSQLLRLKCHSLLAGDELGLIDVLERDRVHLFWRNACSPTNIVHSEFFAAR